MKVIGPWFMVFLLTSCTHEVHSLTVDEVVQDKINSAVGKSCKENSCALENCWQETESTTYCNVTFYFTLDANERRILTKKVLKLKKAGIKAGFCARDSFADQMTQAFLFGMLGALLAGLSGQAGGGNVTPSEVPVVVSADELGSEPCETQPVAKGASAW